MIRWALGSHPFHQTWAMLSNTRKLFSRLLGAKSQTRPVIWEPPPYDWSYALPRHRRAVSEIKEEDRSGYLFEDEAEQSRNKERGGMKMFDDDDDDADDDDVCELRSLRCSEGKERERNTRGWGRGRMKEGGKGRGREILRAECTDCSRAQPGHWSRPFFILIVRKKNRKKKREYLNLFMQKIREVTKSARLLEPKFRRSLVAYFVHHSYPGLKGTEHVLVSPVNF